jgi:hypothetical protein
MQPVALVWWVQWPVAVLLFAAIVGTGLAFLRAVAGSRPAVHVTPEDVEDLDVFLVCTDCGTEFQVTRLGEVQIPRHCGEPMTLVRRPRHHPLTN